MARCFNFPARINTNALSSGSLPTTLFDTFTAWNGVLRHPEVILTLKTARSAN